MPFESSTHTLTIDTAPLYFLPRSSAALMRRVPAGSSGPSSATDDSSTSDIDEPTGLYSPDAVARRSITEYSALSSCSRNGGYEMYCEW